MTFFDLEDLPDSIVLDEQEWDAIEDVLDLDLDEGDPLARFRLRGCWYYRTGERTSDGGWVYRPRVH